MSDLGSRPLTLLLYLGEWSPLGSYPRFGVLRSSAPCRKTNLFFQLPQRSLRDTLSQYPDRSEFAAHQPRTQNANSHAALPRAPLDR